MPRAKSHAVFEGVSFASDWASALKQADACLIVTAWPEYRKILPGDFKRLMRNPLMIDGRGLFDPNAMAAAGVKWRGIGYLTRKEPYFRSAHFRECTNGADARGPRCIARATGPFRYASRRGYDSRHGRQNSLLEPRG